MTTFATKAIAFNRNIQTYLEQNPLQLPSNYQLLNPFVKGQATAIATDFYHKFYSDTAKRKLIMGINPGRHGAGLTGVPFTDTKHLLQVGIDPRGIETRELSAVFVYQLIAAMGGATQFYRQFYINSPLPLGLVQIKDNGKEVNANYYDNKALKQSCEATIVYCIEQLLQCNIDTATCYCLGMGQNFKFLKQLNQRFAWFQRIVPIEHPRYIMQYQSKKIDQYIDKIVKLLSAN